MAGRIPEQFIDDLLARVDIVDVIEQRVALKKAGRDWIARCPFHDERSPSFTVSPAKQFYHCFGCGAHGSAIRFLMEYESINFVDALERLASRLGLTVPRNPHDSAKIQLKQSTTSVLNRAAEFYAHQLKNHPQAKVAVNYLKKR